MAKFELKKLLCENTYPGRGIVVGKSKDGKNALIAYFIMVEVLIAVTVFLKNLTGE